VSDDPDQKKDRMTTPSTGSTPDDSQNDLDQLPPIVKAAVQHPSGKGPELVQAVMDMHDAEELLANFAEANKMMTGGLDQMLDSASDKAKAAGDQVATRMARKARGIRKLTAPLVNMATGPLLQQQQKLRTDATAARTKAASIATELLSFGRADAAVDSAKATQAIETLERAIWPATTIRSVIADMRSPTVGGPTLDSPAPQKSTGREIGF
jgi:hypothetical protein